MQRIIRNQTKKNKKNFVGLMKMSFLLENLKKVDYNDENWESVWDIDNEEHIWKDPSSLSLVFGNENI